MSDTKFKRNVLILGVLIAVLAATYVLGLVFAPARVEKRRAETPLLAHLDAEAVNGIRLADSEGTVEMSREKGDWRLAIGGRDYPASASRIKVLLDFLSEVKRTRVATTNPELWKDFGVESEAKKRVVLSDQDGGTLLELVVGNQEMSQSGDYVRIQGANEVLLSDRSFSYYTGTDPRFWSNLRIFPEDLRGRDIVRFSVDARVSFGAPGPEGTASVVSARYTLLESEKKPGEWVVEGQPTVSPDGAEVDKLLNDLAGMEAAEFAAGVSPEQAGLSSPRGRIVISTSQGRDYRLLIGDPAPEKQHYVSLEDGEYVYRVAEWRMQSVLRPVEELSGSAGESSN